MGNNAVMATSGEEVAHLGLVGLVARASSGCGMRFDGAATAVRLRFDSLPIAACGQGLRSGRRLARCEWSGQGVEMEIRILGSFDVVGSAGVVDLRGVKRRCLLACLVVHEASRRAPTGWFRSCGVMAALRARPGPCRPMCPSCANCYAANRRAWTRGRVAMCSRSTPLSLTPTGSSKE